MTENANLKRRVRARAAKTGESYTTARRHALLTSFAALAAGRLNALLDPLPPQTSRPD